VVAFCLNFIAEVASKASIHRGIDGFITQGGGYRPVRRMLRLMAYSPGTYGVPLTVLDVLGGVVFLCPTL
jgi:hypothetical protein